MTFLDFLNNHKVLFISVSLIVILILILIFVFAIHPKITKKCVSDCSRHGTCNAGICACDTGDDCSGGDMK